MKKETLISINRLAMYEKERIVLLGHDRKYEWHLWGYLLALYDNQLIDFKEYSKIKEHYREYFKELSRN